MVLKTLSMIVCVLVAVASTATVNNLELFDKIVKARPIAPKVNLSDLEPSGVFQTEYGPIEGSKDADGFRIFHAVPFAMPPLNERRWLGLVPPTPWTETKKTVERHLACPQIDLFRAIHFGSEDCMYLSIYVPKACTKETPCPVMQWIYGGAWVIGGNNQYNMYDAKKLAKAHNVVVIAANYRLDALGWMALQELQDEASEGQYGNYGVQDQRFAMQWMRRNIGEFGGNPNAVTIFGESAGGFSVCQHLVSPASNGLFSNAIIESGDCSGPWIILDGESNKDFGNLYATLVGCPDTGDAKSRLACLRGLPVSKLLEPYNTWLCPVPRPDSPWCNRTLPNNTATYDMFAPASDNSKWPINRPPFAPIAGFAASVDGSQIGLPDFPQKLIEQGKINKGPNGEKIKVLMGTNEHELALFMPALFLIVPAFTLSYPFDLDTVSEVTKHLIAYIPGADVDGVLNTVLKTYPLREHETEINRLVHAATDALFRCGTRRAANALADNGNDVYVYHFNMQKHRLYQDPASLVCDLDLMVGCGVPHFDEVKYVFDNFQLDSEPTKQLGKRIGAYWTNFAKTGNPNSADSNPKWPLHTRAGDTDLMLGERDSVVKNAHSRGCNMWDSVLPKFTNTSK